MVSKKIHFGGIGWYIFGNVQDRNLGKIEPILTFDSYFSDVLKPLDSQNNSVQGMKNNAT